MIKKRYLIDVERETVARYSNRYKTMGISPKTLGWGTKQDQIERFKIIIEHCSINGKTIMDIGCGFADLYLYLQEQGYDFKYIGVDINNNFIEYCKAKFPEHQFYCTNIVLEESVIPKVDLVVALGVLNFKLKDISNYDYSKQFIKRAFYYAKEKLIVDFLSEYTTTNYDKEDFVFYHSPEIMFEYAMQLSGNVNLIHDYPPIPQKEFMIILNK